MSLAQGYQTSGLSRREYCQQVGIPKTTLDYYLRRGKTKEPRIVPVTIVANKQPSASGFQLLLSNGLRIECGWEFTEAGLKSLLRIAGQA